MTGATHGGRKDYKLDMRVIHGMPNYLDQGEIEISWGPAWAGAAVQPDICSERSVVARSDTF